MVRIDITRRDALGSAGLAIGALAVAPAPAIAEPSAGMTLRQSPLGQIKMEACLDGSPAVWTYGGFIYAVRPGERPRAILAISGGSSSWARRQDDGSWRMLGATMSCFRDPQSGAFIDHFDNPYTGRRVEVHANVVAGGSMVYPADGSAPRFVGKSKAGEVAPGGFNVADPNRPLGRVNWIESPATMMLMTDHAFEVPVQPELEARTIMAERHAFEDRRIMRLPTRVTTTTILPWMRWMQMGEVPGHLVWHCSGEKYFDVANLPADFRARAGSLLDQLRTPPAG